MGRIEVVTIGDELVEGRLVDTNAGWMSARLADAGLAVARHTSVGDDRGEIVAALREAAGRSTAVLVSGGLGPTTDDLTARCAAEAARLAVERHPAALAHVETFFAARGRRMSPNNGQQADLPAGCDLLPNPNGTAVGFRVELGRCGLWFMPGVPRELEAMVSDYVLPQLLARLTPDPPLVATLKVFGLGESEVGQRLDGLESGIEPPARLLIQYRATFPEIHVRLVLRGGDGGQLDGLREGAARRLGEHVFAAGGATVETGFAAAAVARLVARGVRVGLAESLTSGRAATLLAESAEADAVLAGGEVGAFPPADCEARAESIRRRLGATHGLAVAGDPAAGEVRIAVASESGTTSRELHYPIDAERLRTLAAYAALALLVRTLQR